MSTGFIASTRRTRAQSAFIGVLLAAAAPSGLAQPAPASGPPTALPANVHAVVSGGYWQAEGRGGHYRVVVTTAGFEALSSQVFVEWIADPSLPDEAPSVVARVDTAASSGEPITWQPSLKPIMPGCASLVLRGTNSMLPGEHPRRAFWALGPGRLVAATPARRPESCRTSPRAARQP